MVGYRNWFLFCTQPYPHCSFPKNAIYQESPHCCLLQGSVLQWMQDQVAWEWGKVKYPKCFWGDGEFNTNHIENATEYDPRVSSWAAGTAGVEMSCFLCQCCLAALKRLSNCIQKHFKFYAHLQNPIFSECTPIVTLSVPPNTGLCAPFQSAKCRVPPGMWVFGLRPLIWKCLCHVSPPNACSNPCFMLLFAL